MTVAKMRYLRFNLTCGVLVAWDKRELNSRPEVIAIIKEFFARPKGA